MTIKSQERVLCCQHTRLKSPKTFSGGRTRAQAHHRAHLCIPNVAKNGQKTSATWQKSRLEDALLGILDKLSKKRRRLISTQRRGAHFRTTKVAQKD